MLVIVDYGVGNLFSLRSSLKYIGADAVITGDKELIRSAERIILPGVGAFGDAAEKLRSKGLDKVVCSAAAEGKPLLGICLGMQLLFEKSWEFGEHEGLGLLKGEVIPMQGRLRSELRIPHIGWNALHKKAGCPILKYTDEGEYVYFVHSFFVPGSNENCCASAEYDEEVTAVAAKGNVFGCQFHPEKSGDAGLSILRAFCEI